MATQSPIDLALEAARRERARQRAKSFTHEELALALYDVGRGLPNADMSMFDVVVDPDRADQAYAIWEALAR